MVRGLSVQAADEEHRRRYPPTPDARLRGPRQVLSCGKEGYPDALMELDDPPQALYVVGNVDALREGLAVIGARKATPYGLAAARRFSALACEHGVPVVSGGALGCDSAAHEGALDAAGQTVVVLGGGCDRVYPARNFDLFQRVVDCGGAVVSEQAWDFPPLPYTFRARNRIIAGLSRATLIVEAGLPSGTFSTADDALAASREVLAVPGPITSPTSRGSNRLIYQGATPIVDEESFEDALVGVFGCLRIEDMRPRPTDEGDDALLAALRANPMRIEEMLSLSEGSPAREDRLTWIMVRLASYERDGLIARFPDGRYGPARV